jgi:membrane protease YdiL (CAAX protease family)
MAAQALWSQCRAPIAFIYSGAMHRSLRTDPQSGSSQTVRTTAERLISLAEVIVGSLVVLGYNVWHVLPVNSVFLLSGMALISIRFRESSWSAIGFRRPKSWTKTLLIAVGAAMVQQAVGQFVVDPLTKPYLHYAAAANPIEVEHGYAGLLRWVGIIWTYAAVGEELVYRRYLLNRVADLGGQSRFALLLGLIWSSVLFGCAHWYQGAAGIVSAMASGLVYGAAYLSTRKNLWASICAHGFSDSFALIATYFGIAT